MQILTLKLTTMADESKTIILPENQNNGWNSGIPAVLALNGLGYNNYPPYAYGNGGLFGGSGSGFGAGILGGLLGGLIWNGIGNGNWGFNSWGNGGGGAAASLGAQARPTSTLQMQFVAHCSR